MLEELRHFHLLCGHDRAHANFVLAFFFYFVRRYSISTWA